MPLVDRFRSLFDAARAARATLPTRVAIPPAQVDDVARLGAPLARGAQYFQVRLNEMFLSHARRWFVEYEPMVFVGSEFIYDRAETAVPVVVGPSLLDRFGKQDVPAGMVFENTRVAGMHPYRGGRLAISVVVYRIPREDYARRLLGLVERTAEALDFSTALAAYTRIAGALVEGVEALTGLGKAAPVIGHRREIDPDAGDALHPGYFALVDAEEGSLDPATLWVREGRLHVGRTRDAAVPYREADYILYSIASTAERSDVSTLPFYPQWEHVQREAAVPTDDAWKSAKANMLALYQSLVLAPDLTPAHAERLADEYARTMKARHQRAVDLGQLGGGVLAEDDGATRAVARGIGAPNGADGAHAGAVGDPLARVRARGLDLVEL